MCERGGGGVGPIQDRWVRRIALTSGGPFFSVVCRGYAHGSQGMWSQIPDRKNLNGEAASKKVPFTVLGARCLPYQGLPDATPSSAPRHHQPPTANRHQPLTAATRQPLK